MYLMIEYSIAKICIVLFINPLYIDGNMKNKLTPFTATSVNP